MMTQTFADRLAKRFHELWVQGAPAFNQEVPDAFRGAFDALDEASRNLLSFTFARLESELVQHVVNRVRTELPAFAPPESTEDKVEERDATPA